MTFYVIMYLRFYTFILDKGPKREKHVINLIGVLQNIILRVFSYCIR